MAFYLHSTRGTGAQCFRQNLQSVSPELLLSAEAAKPPYFLTLGEKTSVHQEGQAVPKSADSHCGLISPWYLTLSHTEVHLISSSQPSLLNYFVLRFTA